MCVVDGDSPRSALIISLAGSCTCGVSEYSSEMTVSQMSAVSSSCLTVVFKLVDCLCDCVLLEQSQSV